MHRHNRLWTLAISLFAVAAFGWLGFRLGPNSDPSKTQRGAGEPLGGTEANRPSAHSSVAQTAHGTRTEDQHDPQGADSGAQLAETPPPPPELMFPTTHARWSGENKTAKWGPAYEAELHALLDELDLPGADLVSADCRETLCRIELECDSRETLDKVLRAASARETLRSRMAMPWVDGGHFVGFLTPALADPERADSADHG